MPLHDLGYRRWPADRSSTRLRFLVIGETGIRRAWQTTWLRRLLLASWVPMLGTAIGFFLFEQSLAAQDLRQFYGSFLRDMPMSDAVTNAALVDVNNPESVARARHQIWSYLLNIYFRYPQASIMVMVVGLIAPSLISQDVRSRAFLLYFSRPLSRQEYILGKSVTVWFYLAGISVVPAVVLYLFGVMLSPDLSVILDTWDLPFRIFLASLALMIPTTALALMFSSLTEESRYAAFAWFAFWILGWVTYSVLTVSDAVSGNPNVAESIHRWEIVSPFHTLGRVENYIFGLSSWSETKYPAINLAAVTAFCLVMLFRRVSKPLRA